VKKQAEKLSRGRGSRPAETPPRAEASGPVEATRKLVVGPFVVVEEAVVDGRHVILDIYEVRGGKVVHQWESGDYARWVHKAQSD